MSKQKAMHRPQQLLTLLLVISVLQWLYQGMRNNGHGYVSCLGGCGLLLPHTALMFCNVYPLRQIHVWATVSSWCTYAGLGEYL